MKLYGFFAQRKLHLLLIILLSVFAAHAQTTSFTYQGRLNDQTNPSGGSYLFKFELYNAASDGALIDTISDVSATVSNGVFTVELNFTAANAFDGAERFLQISVKRNAGDVYTTLAPRQKLTSAPYAVRALNAAQLNGVAASQFVRETDTRLTDSRDPRAGSGNYIQNQNSSPQTSTNFNISGSGAANVFNAESEFQIGGGRVFRIPGTANTYVGSDAGAAHTAGAEFNSFFGRGAGFANATGDRNAFFGENAGRNNTAGTSNSFFGTAAGLRNLASDNSFFGAEAGASNTSGRLNVFVGRNAGLTNQTGGDNTALGAEAGNSNAAGSNNTYLGRAAGFGATGNDNTFVGWSAAAGIVNGSNNTALGSGAAIANNNLSFATAIGAGASATSSNSIVLGRSADTVQIPGNLNVAGSIGTLNVANINATGSVSAASGFQIGGNRILFGSTAGANIYAGFGSGGGTTGGAENSFFGSNSGETNTGNFNTFIGKSSGAANTTGSDNSFFGRQTGNANTTGSRNTFVGVQAGFGNTTGSSNTFLGFNTVGTANNLTYATAIGADASVSESNTIVLGRSGGGDSVRIPGRLFVSDVPSGDRRNMQWDSNTGQLFQDTSSRRYKENIRPLTVDFRQILQAVPQTYTRPGIPNRWEIGFIAEDLDALGLKPLVEYDKDGRPDGVNYDKIPLYLTRIAADQQEEINRLTEENNRLKMQFEELKKLVCAQNRQAEICK